MAPRTRPSFRDSSFAPSPVPRPAFTRTVWRGAASARWHWWLAALPLALMLTLLDGLGLHTQLQGGHLQGLSLLLLLLWTMTLAVLVWSGSGLWRHLQRAARSAVAAGAGRGASNKAAAGACIALLALSAAAAAWLLLPRAAELLQAAAGGDPQGTLQATLSADGRALALRGPISAGSARRVAALTQAAPQLRLLTLHSNGGRIDEAEALATWARNKSLRTRAVGPCHGACVLSYMAGTRRQVAGQAQLALGPPLVHGLNPLWRGLVNRHWAGSLGAAGLPQAAVHKAMSMPAERPWRVEVDELASHAFVTRHERPLDVDLPEPRDASAAEFLAALDSHAIWRALHRRAPTLLNQAAALMQAAHAAGLPPQAVQAAGQQLIDPLLPGLLAGSRAELQQDFVALLAEQARALKAMGLARCGRLGADDMPARQLLPPAWAEREAAWLALAAPEAPSVHKPLNGLEGEVLRRSLGAANAATLRSVWSTSAAGRTELSCDAAMRLLGEVQALPAAERRLALRWMFVR